MEKLARKAAAFFALIAMTLSLASSAIGAQPCQEMSHANTSQHHGHHQSAPSHTTSDCPHALLGSACSQMVAAPATVAFSLVTTEQTSAFGNAAQLVAPITSKAFFHPPRI